MTKMFVGHKHNFEKNLLKCAWSPDDSKITAGSADRYAFVAFDFKSIFFQLGLCMYGMSTRGHCNTSYQGTWVLLMKYSFIQTTKNQSVSHSPNTSLVMSSVIA